MPYTIAVAGKGGTGKTTLCGFLIEYLASQNKGPILAVDADANSNLNEVLGVEVETTLGSIREEVAKADISGGTIPAGMSKQEYMDFKFSDALIEMDDYDMLVMGRTQGEGCYCFVNGLLQTQINKFAGNYKYLVVDNEAGMEHISRGILPKVDIILLVSDASRRGIQAAGRIGKLVKEMDMNVSDVKLIVNKAPNGELSEGLKEEIALQELDLLGVIPQDQMVYEYDTEGKPTAALPDSSDAKKALGNLISQIVK